jgi:hypothetical protein
MKAKDLAALAALGVAGFAAYDKFGKKDEPKKKMGEGLDMTNQGAYERASRPKADESDAMNEVNPYDTEAMMPRGGKRDRVDRAAEIEAEFGPKGSGGIRSTDVGQGSSSAETTPKAKLRAAEDSNNASVALAANAAAAAKAAKQAKEAKPAAAASSSSSAAAEAAPASTTRKFTPPGTQSSMGALSGASRPAAGNQAMAAMDRATVPAQRNVGSGNAAMGAFSQVQAVPRNIKYATEAEKARQARIDENTYDSQLNRDRRQAVVDTVKNIPANVKNAFKPLTKQEIIDQKNYDSQLNRDRREAAFGSVKNLFGFKKGGAVKKMASGGMTSSKMSSKPSTASSRGDGIAQRGKTRGQMR